MKVAIVHELLTIRGGAERVAKIFADMFPDAPVYTLLYDGEKLGDWFPSERVRLPKKKILNSQFLGPRSLGEVGSILNSSRPNHHLHLRRFPAAVESWDFSGFDLVLSSSSAFAHGIITNGNPKHICYVHSPARYLWDSTHDVLERAGQGFLGPLKRRYLEKTFHELRIWDAEVAPRPDRLIANSREVQRRIELYWRRESKVIHPPIDDFWLQREPQKVGMKHPDSFLIVSTLAPYKQIDRAVRACNACNVHLKIVGDGPDRKHLESIADDNIEFYGHREGDELHDLYGNAKALILPGREDFGLTPLESMACGTPVIALKAGGALETVMEGKTGTFFEEPMQHGSRDCRAVESLVDAIRNFNPDKYSVEDCRTRAAEFGRERFEEEMRKVIDAM